MDLPDIQEPSFWMQALHETCRQAFREILCMYALFDSTKLSITNFILYELEISINLKFKYYIFLKSLCPAHH